MGLTIRDIAKKANVSMSTVSRVLNNYPHISSATKQKVADVIHEMNYVPSVYARSLSSQNSNIIGVVVPEISNPFFGGVIKGITQIADQENYNILLCNTDEDQIKERNALRMLQEYRIKGLIITPVTERGEYDKDYVEMFRNFGIDLVLVDRDIKYGNFNAVLFDDTTALFDLTSLLIENGHRDIAILAGDPRHVVSKRRVEGYISAFGANGLEYKPSDIYASSFSIEGAYCVTKKILDSCELPTAIIGSSNMLSMGCLKALSEHTLTIPNDIAFAGYDALDMHEILNLNFTLVEKDVELLGRKAMNLLIANFQHQSNDVNKIMLTPKLVVRGSEKFPKGRSSKSRKQCC